MEEQAPTQTDKHNVVLLSEKIRQIQGHYISLVFLFWFFSCSLCSVNLRVKANKVFFLLWLWRKQQHHLPHPSVPFAGKRFLIPVAELLSGFSALTLFILVSRIFMHIV